MGSRASPEATGHNKARAGDNTAIALEYLQSPGLDQEPKSTIPTSQCPVPNTTQPHHQVKATLSEEVLH